MDQMTLWLLSQAQAGKLEPTISGGPPSFTGTLGQQVFDTKYGITWWYDGTNWHANGAGQLTARIYWNAGGALSTTVVPFDTVSFDPSSSVGTSRFICPIAGRYLVTVSLQVASSAATFQAGIAVNGSVKTLGAYAGSSTWASSVTDIVSVAATNYIQAYLGGSATLMGNAATTYMSVEFVSV
jgi:hypothetical protein